MLYKLKTFIWIFFVMLFIFVDNLIAQKTFTVEYLYKETKELRDSFYFKLLKPAETITQIDPEKRLYPLKDYKFLKADSGINESICTYIVSDTTCSIIWDGFGYESFVIPDDTIKIYFKKKPKIEGHYWINKGKNYQSVWFHDFLFEGKNRYVYSLFDSLAYYSNTLQYGSVNLQKAALRLDTFFQMVTDLYRGRIDYLNHYCLLYNIPNTIKRLASAEIKSAYIINLTQPMTNIISSYSITDYPKEYLDTLSTFNVLNDEKLFLNTLLYSDAVYRYIELYKTKLISDNSTEESLFKKKYLALSTIEESKRKIQESLLFYCLLRNLKSNFGSFPSFLADFKKAFPNSPTSQYLDSLYGMEKNKPLFTYEQALNSIIETKRGNKITLKKEISNKPVFIDCWASWCIPCLNQMPFEDEIKRQYGDKIDFIYLSFDKDKEKWLGKGSQLKLNKNSYLLDRNFKSDFAYFFNISSIPHYLIFDNKGKLITSNAPRPSQKSSLKEILDKTLSNNNQ